MNRMTPESGECWTESLNNERPSTCDGENVPIAHVRTIGQAVASPHATCYVALPSSVALACVATEWPRNKGVFSAVLMPHAAGSGTHREVCRRREKRPPPGSVSSSVNGCVRLSSLAVIVKAQLESVLAHRPAVRGDGGSVQHAASHPSLHPPIVEQDGRRLFTCLGGGRRAERWRVQLLVEKQRTPSRRPRPPRRLGDRQGSVELT